VRDTHVYDQSFSHVLDRVNPDMTSETDVRRRPSQARSRARFDQILSAAASLIAERGVDPVSMTDIAERAGMGLPAVYRYFPNKSVVLKELALQTFAHDTETLVSLGPSTDGSAQELLAAGIREYWQRHLDEPFRLQLRLAIHADPELSALDLAESRRNAASIAEVMGRDAGSSDPEQLERRALLLVELLDSLMRLVDRLEPDEAEAMVAEFIAMTTNTLVVPTVAAAPRPGRRARSK